MRDWIRLIVVAVPLLVSPLPGAGAGALDTPKTNITSDITDVWWPNAESGWGIQFVHNAETVFATMYVYGASGQPTFYVAVLTNTPVGGGVWTGPLSSTTGPYFGGPFNPAAVVETVVGTMTFTLTGLGTGTLAYNVGATNVTKSLNRQPLDLENNSDEYKVMTSFSGFAGAGCGFDDYPPQDLGTVSIYQVGTTASITLSGWSNGKAATCTANPAAYSQVGRIGQYQGTLACPGGRTASLLLYDIANRVKMLSGRYTLVWDDDCRLDGRFSAIATTP